MGRKSKVLPQIKIKVVEEYLSGKVSLKQIAYNLDVSCTSVEGWVRKYKSFGVESLITKKTNKIYPPEIKLKAVTDYLNGEGSLYDIAIRYRISSHSILLNWIKQYNGHKILKTQKNRGDIIMTNGRTTTFEERLRIVTFCIANANDYRLTATEYKVSYQQVYSWVKKYNTNGYEALADKRGKRKSFDELNESEKIAAHFKKMETENRRLKMENDFLKKLQEIERR